MSKERRYWHPFIGFNYRMTNLQAAIGVAQMERIEAIIQKKRENAQTYASLLSNVPGVTLPMEAEWARNVYWMYCILIDNSLWPPRDQIISSLKTKGVDTRPLFYPIHSMPPYRSSDGHFPVAEDISRRGINLPSGVGLTAQDIKRVVDALICELSR